MVEPSCKVATLYFMKVNRKPCMTLFSQIQVIIHVFNSGLAVNTVTTDAREVDSFPVGAILVMVEATSLGYRPGSRSDIIFTYCRPDSFITASIGIAKGHTRLGRDIHLYCLLGFR